MPSLPAAAFAQPGAVRSQVIEHSLVRRLIVFPLQVEPALATVADEAWWQVREQLSKSRRFLVASKQFMVRSDVFQPRGELAPADVIILGRLVDAHALLTMQLQERRLTLNAYDGANGLLLWSKTYSLHPSLTAGDQLPALAVRAVSEFVAAFPYQGFTAVDSLIGRAVYEEGDVKLAQVDLGLATGAQIGDLVQWIRVLNTTAAPLFQGGGKITVVAEGKIVRLDQGVAVVEILRAKSIDQIKEHVLVRVPREAQRLQEEFEIQETTRPTLTLDLMTPEANPEQRREEERRPLMMVFSVLGSIAAFLLLAF